MVQRRAEDTLVIYIFVSPLKDISQLNWFYLFEDLFKLLKCPVVVNINNALVECLPLLINRIVQHKINQGYENQN